MNVIVICVGEKRSGGETLGHRKGSKIFWYATISQDVMSLPTSYWQSSELQSVHKLRLLSLVSQSLACGQMKSAERKGWPMGKACSTSSTRTHVSNTSANFALNDTSCSKSKRQKDGTIKCCKRHTLNADQLASIIHQHRIEGHVTLVSGIFQISL